MKQCVHSAYTHTHTQAVANVHWESKVSAHFLAEMKSVCKIFSRAPVNNLANVDVDCDGDGDRDGDGDCAAKPISNSKCAAENELLYITK